MITAGFFIILFSLIALTAVGKTTVEGSRGHYWGRNSGRDTIRQRESQYWNKK